jgi:hypothetical protein
VSPRGLLLVAACALPLAFATAAPAATSLDELLRQTRDARAREAQRSAEREKTS